MPGLPLEEWDDNLFEELQQVLLRVTSQSTTTTSTLRRLYTLLDQAEPWLLALTQLPGPSEEERQYLERNPLVLPSGSTLQLTGDILNTTNTVSNLLSISQRLATVLTVRADEKKSRYPARSIPEIATYLLHSWTIQMLTFFHELLRMTINPTAEIDQLSEPLYIWVRNLLQKRTKAGKGEGTLVDVILSELDESQRKLDGLVRTQRVMGPEYDLLVFRVKSTRVEQGKLVGLLVSIAEGGIIGRGHVIKVLKWLKKVDRVDGLVGGVLGSFYALSRPLDQIDKLAERHGTNQQARDELAQMADEWCKDIKFLKIASSLVFSEDWAVPKLREAAKLAWSLFIHSTLRHDPTAAQVGIDPPTADQYLQDAVNGEAFQFLRDLVFSIRQERGLEEKDEIREAAEDVLVKLASTSNPETDTFFFAQLQDLIDSIISKKHFLRNQRNREEDSASRRSTLGLPAQNFQAFLSLVSVVYKSLPSDSAQYLWDDVVFTSVVLDPRSQYPGPALWDMLGSISAGRLCAEKSYEKIKESRMQWNQLFKLYQYYLEKMPAIFDPIPTTRNTSPYPVDSGDVSLCRGWTDLLATVVRWSPLAKSALLQAKPFPLQLLFDFINRDLPVELKTSIMQAITAFCVRSGDSADDEVLSKTVEQYGRVSFADPGLDTRLSDKIPPSIGWLAKMEYAEQDVSAYPLTRAYLRFLTSLLPGSSASPRLTVIIRRSAFYIIDRVLIGFNSRRFVRESERWEMLDEAFAFLEKALQVFNLSELVSGNNRTVGPIASALYEEAGFVILLRLLSEKDVFELLASVVDTVQAIDRTRIIDSVLSRVLRIYHRVLDTQLVFSDVLLLVLTDHTRNATHVFRRPLNLQSLDHLLLGHLSNISAIGLLVGDDDLPISLISTKIISALASSPVFNQTDRFRGEYSRSVNRLAGIIDASDDSIRISQSFCSRLESDGVNLSPAEVDKVEERALNGSITPQDLSILPLVIRSKILDILLDGTTLDASAPNIAHFLLGFEFKGHEFVLQDPDAPGSRYSGLQVVLDQIRGGVDIDIHQPPSDTSLVEIYPVLAAKTAKLLYQLFSHPNTGRATMAYATAMEGLSATQLTILPRECPSTPGDGLGLVSTLEGEYETTADTLVAYLDFHRSIMSCVALETHAYEGKGISASTLAEILFRGAVEDENSPAITRLLDNIDISWREPIQEEKNLDYYGSFEFDTYKRPDVDWYDIDALTRALKSYQRMLERSGAISGGVKGMESEAAYIVRELSRKNRDTEINLAKGSYLTAWAEMLKVALGRLFAAYVPEERQEAVLFELLDALLRRIEGDVSPGVLDILAESVLVTMSTLVSTLSEFEGINIPVENLASVLAKTIDVIVRPGTTENARGNLYASISQYLSLLSGSTSIVDDASLIGTTIGRDISGSSLQKATIAVLGSRKDRFLAVVSRDAIDVRDVWKTECFALLGGLVGICESERDRQVLSPLFKEGYLPLFIRSVKDCETALQETLAPDADGLHAYWVFEAKIAFLLAVATSRKGAEDLLDAGIFEILATCGFIAVHPINEESHAFIETVQRQHQVLIYILQLLARTLTSLHKSSRSGAGHAISFLNAHRDSILLVLRESVQSISALGVEECRLIISILAMVIHKVPEGDRRAPSGFGAFHLSALAVAARFFEPSWTDAFEGTEDRQTLDTAVLGLNQAILTYLCGSTADLKAGGGYPVLVNGGHRANGGSKYISTAPSLQTLLDLLGDLIETTQEAASEYETISDRLQDSNQLTEDDLQKWPTLDALDDFITPDTLRLAYSDRIQLLYNMIESILLLFWRHLLFYANDARGEVRPDNLSSSLGGSALELSKSGVGAIKALERVAAGLRGILERLADVSVSPELRKGGEKTNAYFGMLVRRLRELTAGLTGGSE